MEAITYSLLHQKVSGRNEDSESEIPLKKNKRSFFIKRHFLRDHA